MIEPGFTDSHCHLLPGIDDGAGSIDDALEMAAVLAAAGFTRVWCTPHRIAGVFDPTPVTVLARVAELESRLAQAGIRVALLPATEYCLDELLLPSLSAPLPLDNSMLLIEVPSISVPDFIGEMALQVIRSGFVPLIAHPERSQAFSCSPDTNRDSGFSLRESVRSLFPGRRRSRTGFRDRSISPLLTLLAEMGCRFQGNIGSFAGIYGGTIRDTAIGFLKKGLYDRLGSDAHTPAGMGEWLGEGLDVVRNLVGEETLHRLLRPGNRREATVRSGRR